MSDPAAPAVTVVVVHYRGHDVLDRCLRSCLVDALVAEVLVVDNSGDAVVAAELATDPRVRVLTMAGNLGYGRAANAGLAVARTPAALVLNQDAALTPGAVAELLDVARATDAWIVGPRLVDDDGRSAPPKPPDDRLHRWSAPPADPSWPARVVAVPWVSGAALLLAPGHADLRFDARFFVYVEDEELGIRVWETGGRVVWAGAVAVLHSGGTATTRRWGRATIALRILAGRTRLARRHGTRAALHYLVGSVTRRVTRSRR